MSTAPEHRDVREEVPVERIAALLEDSTARTILTETSQQPMSASTLSERCEVSRPTVYRRLDDLRDCGLLLEQTEIDPDAGHHRTLYATNLQQLNIELRDGGFTVSISRREPPADRFTRLIEEI